MTIIGKWVESFLVKGVKRDVRPLTVDGTKGGEILLTPSQEFKISIHSILIYRFSTQQLNRSGCNFVI